MLDWLSLEHHKNVSCHIAVDYTDDEDGSVHFDDGDDENDLNKFDDKEEEAVDDFNHFDDKEEGYVDAGVKK